MKTVLIILAALVLVAVVGLGFYRGWFDFSSSNDESKSNVTLSVDKDKIETDKDDAVEKAQDLGHEAVDKISPSPEKAQR
jgi:hypothetical protein